MNYSLIDRPRRFMAVVLLAMSIAACGSPTFTTNGVDLLIAELATPGETTSRRDPVELRAARIAGDRLEIDVTYGGGCREHLFAVAHDGAFAESYPVQTRLTLLHDANGDVCRALVHRALAFDVTSLRAAYRAAYGEGHGILVIHLHGPVPGSDDSIGLHWEF